MAASGSSSWPTTRVQRGAYTRDRGDPAKARPTLEGLAADWMTRIGRTMVRADGSKVQLGLEHQARQWMTPSAQQFEAKDLDLMLKRQAAAAEKNGNNGFGLTLGNQVQIWTKAQAEAASWPTPAARDCKGTNSAEHVTTNGTGRMHMDQLPNFVAYAFQPLHPDLPIPAGPTSLQPIPFAPLPSDGSISGPLLDAMRDFRRWSMRSGGAAGWRGTWVRTPRRALNPRFVERLMRWPIGWSGFGSLETGLTPWLDAMRTYYWTLDTARAASVTQAALL